MESCTSNKSLMTGNVSTDESRNEIKNRPGAPSVPANATIFCFHAFNPPPTFRSGPGIPIPQPCHSERSEESAFFRPPEAKTTSPPLPQSHPKPDAIPPAKSHTAAAHTPHCPEAAAALRVPEKIYTTSAASPTNTRHHQCAVRLPRSSRSA